MSAENENRVKKPYQFFLEKEKSKEGFDLDELINITGWSKPTVRRYPTKNGIRF